jgi:hypothetical protein
LYLIYEKNSVSGKPHCQMLCGIFSKTDSD